MLLSRLRRHCQPAFALFTVTLLAAIAVLGQGLTGRLSGTIVDATGAVLSGADVTATNVDTRQVRSTKTDSAGYFSFNELLPGTYTVSVNSAGFKRFEQQSISVTATERV